MPTRWFQLTVRVPTPDSEAVANFLTEQGAPGLQIEDQDGTTNLTAYFAEPPPVVALQRFCAAIGCGVGDTAGAVIRIEEVADENWAENWKQHFEPQPVGEHLYICPSWAAAAPAGRHAIIIDPGMAFGTGQHATTRGCLEQIEHFTQTRRIERALDVGTGSGVLAIAMVKLGVAEVWAVENDPIARAVAQANTSINAVAEHVRIVASLAEVEPPFDLVVANLFANLLRELAPALTALLRPAGAIVCSGLLLQDEAAVRAQYAAHAFAATFRTLEDQWVTLAFERQDSA